MHPVRKVFLLGAAAALCTACGSNSSEDATPRASTGSAGSSTAPSTAAGSVADLPASQIVERAVAALKAADSVHVSVTGGRYGSDFRYSGERSVGTVTGPGSTFEVRKFGDRVYLKSDPASWTKSLRPAQVKRLAGRWLRTSSADPEWAPVTAAANLAGLADDGLGPEGPSLTKSTQTVDGAQAIEVASAGANRQRLFVAAQGEPRPLRAESDGAVGQVVVRFFDYGVPVEVTVPPDDDVVDVSQLPSS